VDSKLINKFAVLALFAKSISANSGCFDKKEINDVLISSKSKEATDKFLSW
jgi:hypothetical protein